MPLGLLRRLALRLRNALRKDSRLLLCLAMQLLSNSRLAPRLISGTLTLGLLGEKEQNFLEAKPYYDQSGVPVNTGRPTAPWAR